MNNELQREMWNGRAGASWVRHNTLLEQLLAEPGRRCMDTLSVPAGARLLDVGCGCGNQTLEWASRLDAHSKIIGIDISEPMLSLAHDLKTANHSALQAEVEFVMGDASDSLFPNETFDAIYSRFGVMFFSDPTAAFATLRATLKSDGELGFVCWQSPTLNPFFTAPLQAALSVLPQPPSAKPGAPGPFGLADKNIITNVLSDADFRHLSITPLELQLSVGGSLSFDAIFEELVQIGPAAALIAESDPSLKDRAREAVYKCLFEFYSPGNGVAFEANFWVVNARR